MELLNACVDRIYIDNNEGGVIIWQICSNTADEDSLEAVRKKESTYAENCIDANEIGSCRVHSRSTEYALFRFCREHSRFVEYALFQRWH